MHITYLFNHLEIVTRQDFTIFIVIIIKIILIIRMRHYLTFPTLLLCLAPISEVEGRGLADPRLLGGLVIRFRYNQALNLSQC